MVVTAIMVTTVWTHRCFQPLKHQCTVDVTTMVPGFSCSNHRRRRSRRWGGCQSRFRSNTLPGGPRIARRSSWILWKNQLNENRKWEAKRFELYRKNWLFEKDLNLNLKWEAKQFWSFLLNKIYLNFKFLKNIFLKITLFVSVELNVCGSSITYRSRSNSLIIIHNFLRQ